MESIIDSIRKRLAAEAAKVKNARDVEALEHIFLGRKGELSLFADRLKTYGVEERRKYGMALNELRNEINKVVGRLRSAFENVVKEARPRFDVTRPGIKRTIGHLHPLTQTRREVERIFTSMGFNVVDGPEVETEWYNFDALNVPRYHPARDMQDTFWLAQSDNNKSDPRKHLLLRTHTSPVQVRYMQTHEPPIRAIVPGRVFRYEASDASHDVQFYQFEGLMVDKEVSVANFKAVIRSFFERLFRKSMRIRLRPGYFPFTEPSFEIDISCPKCGGTAGCNLCKHSGWLELAGAGMVHQNVFTSAGYPYGVYTGFAFGAGLDRLTMIRYGIDDLRLFSSGDMRFLRQF